MNLNNYAILKMNCGELEKMKRFCIFWKDFYESILDPEAEYVDQECLNTKISMFNTMLDFIEDIKNPPKIDSIHDETVKELTNNMFDKYKEWK